MNKKDKEIIKVIDLFHDWIINEITICDKNLIFVISSILNVEGKNLKVVLSNYKNFHLVIDWWKIEKNITKILNWTTEIICWWKLDNWLYYIDVNLDSDIFYNKYAWKIMFSVDNITIFNINDEKLNINNLLEIKNKLLHKNN